MKKIINIFILSFILLSCHNNKISEIQSMLNSTFIVTEELEKEFIKLRKENDFIIITYIDSTDCTNCKLSELAVYKLYEEKLKQEFSTEVFLIINYTDEEEISMLMESVSLSFPYILDQSGEIKENNYIPKETAFQTFILNKDNKIIWIGSPIYDENSWSLYKMFMEEIKLKQ